MSLSISHSLFICNKWTLLFLFPFVQKIFKLLIKLEMFQSNIKAFCTKCCCLYKTTFVSNMKLENIIFFIKLYVCMKMLWGQYYYYFFQHLRCRQSSSDNSVNTILLINFLGFLPFLFQLQLLDSKSSVFFAQSSKLKHELLYMLWKVIVHWGYRREKRMDN